MKTLDLTLHKVTLEELLRWATLDSILIRAQDGHEFVLEEADDFEKEVTYLLKM